jgi:hypothetical protein
LFATGVVGELQQAFADNIITPPTLKEDNPMRELRDKEMAGWTIIEHRDDENVVGQVEYNGLCWAHPQRKLRDLAASDKLTNAKQKHCQSVYRKFSDLYAKVEQAKQGFDEGKKPIDSQIQKFKKTFLSIAKPHPKDPEKLATIKATLTERCDRYFVCLVVPGIPLEVFSNP